MKRIIIAIAIVLAVSACTPEQVRQWTYANHGPEAHLTDAEAKFWAGWMMEDPIRHHPGDVTTELWVIRAAHEYGIPAVWFADTAWCESRLNSNANSGFYKGTFQHHPGYWPARAAAAGYPGASIYDPEANAMVSAHLWTTSGPHHWPVCSR